MKTRQRSSSIVKVEEVGARSPDEILDQSAYVNYNVEWVDHKAGAWLIHPVLILTGKMLLDTLPGMTQQISWTLTNLLYLSLSYLMFHWVTGIPFQNEMHGGAYDELTLWEQIDEGAQYTPAKKWLFSVPIVLFLASTHYTHYNPWLFAINLTALILVLIPKMPQLHRRRVHFMTETPGTPITPSYPPSGSQTPTDSIPNHVPPPAMLSQAMAGKFSPGK
ncbi:Orm1 type endoplasmic reticulum protein [Punctularia strigosozonata HHB-11173 SS5]|uniref:Orm1 type endoplasmic reticulum protein n=1 Tax=Punctularia strigosozonata (strain HHB-11173) TaxID=741275 RepID=UPI000441788D|nr:Orm1 type endoplasmic reticulum protein [Punctularia strigosozonata HHB-11173 SS5]EIN10857.1 Orm1 type endoplasmic reticulum protein [Punctularia strigosozonata HHB-11173 SS5]